MSDLESSLLTSLLEFTRGRLDELLNSLAANAEQLLLTVFPAATQTQRVQAAASGAEGELNTARGHLSTLTADLGAAPSSLAEIQAAFAELVAAVNAVQRAITDIAAVVPEIGDADQALLSLVRDAVAAGGDTVTGLLQQLGLGGGSVSNLLSLSGTTLSVRLANAANRPVEVATGSLLTLSQTTLAATMDLGSSPALGAVLNTGLAIGLASDGFVSLVVGASAGATATLKVSVDTAAGLRFQAGAKARADLDGSLSVPGVELRALGIEIPDGVPLGLALTGTIGGSLGPIAAVIQGAGVALTIDPAQLGSGNPFSVALQAPTGAGLSVDAGPIHGGGYVQQRAGVYGGALDLNLGPIEIKAVGLIATSPFSLVLVLSVEFMPAIQLSFGFTLNAVGGLLALERTISTDALRAGISNHTADTVLFPSDPVASAPTILQLLATIFPPQQGAFVAGPMLELGWGAPVSFVTARLGVVLALPDPKVILIGSLRVALPAPEAPIVDLRADIYGEITPDHLLFLVSLAGSNIAGFAISGDFGVLIAWGDQPDLAISAGGFHPHYPPPGELAGMHRVSIDLSPPSFITMRTESYLALTSNSFQLGTRIELKAEVAGVGAEAHLEFDALVLWEPTFHFEIDLTAGASLYAFGDSFASVDLSLHVEGPGPWVAQGHASLSLLFFDVTLDIPRISWGSGSNPLPAVVHPQVMARDKLSDPAAWAARLPADANLLVRLAPLADDGTAVVHPLGVLEARQRVLPLEIVIDHIGANPVDVNRVNLGQPLLKPNAPTPATAKAISGASDLFAPGEYLTLTDDQKLSRPAFEPFDSGIVIAADTSAYGTPSSTAYEWFTVCPPEKTFTRHRFQALTGLHTVLLAAGPSGLATLAAANPYTVRAEPVQLADPGVARVRSTVDLGAIAAVGEQSMSTATAARIVAGLAPGTAQWVGAGVGT
jgi:hypothetical protein